jgi:hypothetical protein
VHARRREKRGGLGKIVELRREARGDLGVAAACILAALDKNEQETDEGLARAYAGASMFADGLHELRLIRMALTKDK